VEIDWISEAAIAMLNNRDLEKDDTDSCVEIEMQNSINEAKQQHEASKRVYNNSSREYNLNQDKDKNKNIDPENDNEIMRGKCTERECVGRLSGKSKIRDLKNVKERKITDFRYDSKKD